MPNDGVRSSWKGHNPSKRRTPALRSSVREFTRSTKSTASRTFSRESSAYLGNETLGHRPRRPRPGGEAVGHAGDVVDDPLGQRRPRHALGQLARVLTEPVEEAAQHAFDARMLLAGRLP